MAQRTIVVASDTEVLGMVWKAGTYTLHEDKWPTLLLAAGATEGSGAIAEVKATYTTNLSGANNDLKYTAKAGLGIRGNDVALRYVDPAAAGQSLSISVEGKTIRVLLATDGAGAITSTAGDITTAIAGAAGAAALVDIVNATGNDGTGVVTAMSPKVLSGGSAAVANNPNPPTEYDALNGRWVFSA